MNVGPCMKGRPPFDTPVRHPSRSKSCREGHRAAGEGLAHAKDVRGDAGVLAGEHATGPPEAGGDFVENQQNVVPVAQFADAAEVVAVVEPHSTGALDDRFQNDGGDFIGVGLDQPGEIGNGRLVERFVEAAGGPFGEKLFRKHLGEQPVHPGDRVADTHRGERIAVIAAADGE